MIQTQIPSSSHSYSPCKNLPPMDCLKPHSDLNASTKTKFSFPFSNCLQPPPTPSSKFAPKTSFLARSKSQKSSSDDQLRRASKEALLAKLFASVSSIKAAYAELQSAQYPYDILAVQNADKHLVSELVVLSDLKHKLNTRSLNLPPPHITNLLAEVQEQQSNIKTYEISIKQMEAKIRHRDAEISKLKSRLDDISKRNKSAEKRLNSSGLIGVSVSISDLNGSHFIRWLQQLMKSVRNFVKHLVREMEAKNWDLDLAAKAIENVAFQQPKHKVYAFEAYVCRVMFDGFNHRDFLLPLPEPSPNKRDRERQAYYDEFRQLQVESASQILIQNPGSDFARFVRSKYLKLVQPKMECSFFGNLEQRKLISSGAFPASDFFSAFSEMAKRVWLLHCLAFSYDPPAVAFQVKQGCRFSEVYMESVTSNGGWSSELGGGAHAALQAAFTVVPGFKIGKTVVQSQVYLVPPTIGRPRPPKR